MSFRPNDKRINLGDTWACFDGKKIHAFFLQFQRSGEESGGTEVGAIGHATSDDMLHWEQLPTAVCRGENGSYDDLEHWTGCTVFNDGKYYVFYTSRSSKNPDFSNSVTISEDGVNFKKYENNPLFTPDEKYYFGENVRPDIRFHGNYYPGKKDYDYRDFAVAYDKENGEWLGYYVVRLKGDNCAETAAIGLARSKDLLNWTQEPPCFVPKRYHVLETPDVFYMDGKWYLLCLSGNLYGQRHCSKDTVQYDRITFFAVADNPRGPFHEVSDNLLVANMNSSAACAKTILVGDKRFLFYTEVLEGAPTEYDLFMSTPKEVATENGNLVLKWYNGVENYYSKKYNLNAQNKILNDGLWGTIGNWDIKDNTVKGYCENDWCCQPFDVSLKNFVFEATVCCTDAESTAFLFDLGDSVFGGGHSVILDYSLNQVLITEFRRFNILDAHDFKFQKAEYNLRVYVNGFAVEIYLDNKLVLHHLLQREGGRLGLLVERGSAEFKNTVINELTPF